MFAWWGKTVYRFRYLVIAVSGVLCVAAGIFGMSLGQHVTQSGFFDEGSESAEASRLADQVYGRDTSGHIIAMYTAPDGKNVDDPVFRQKILDNLSQVERDHPDQILRSIGYFKNPELLANMADSDKRVAFMSIQLEGNNDDTILNNYNKVLGRDGKTVKEALAIDGVNVQQAGLQPLASELTAKLGEDSRRGEVLAIPLVAVVLFFVFGGVIAASLPAIVGGLTILGALGTMRLLAEVMPVHIFAQPVITLVGLGIAIDYGLFIVSRFREEIAEGYDTPTSVRRTVRTSGRTVFFSGLIIVASSAPLLLFPQAFLRSITYAMIATVLLSAVLSVTVLPAALAILGPNVDAFGVRTLLRVPFLRNWKPTNWWLNWLADKTQKTKTREEVEHGFWGRLVSRVMKHPAAWALPIIIGLILLVIPLGQLSLGGISEKYLPPDNAVRQAQEKFDRTFPGFRTEPLTLVIVSDNGQPVTDAQIAEVRSEALSVSGFTEPSGDADKMWQERPVLDGASQNDSVRVIQNGLINRNDAAAKMDALRALSAPHGLSVLVGGTPALEQDSIRTVFHKLPLMAVVLLATTTLLMFLAFGSLVLPIKAALMSILTLGSTMGILTWMFVDGHAASLLNYTPQPLMGPMIALIIAVIYGLSTDYEVLLVSRMVEARERGFSTAEAIRIGTATTGRLITAAALILAVVAGAFAFSDLVMMKYLAFGLLIALLLDATVIRMFLVPAIMKMLGDDCWWAPRWMKRIQTRLGLGELQLPDERKIARPASTESSDWGATAVRVDYPASTSRNPESQVGRFGPQRPASASPRFQSAPDTTTTRLHARELAEHAREAPTPAEGTVSPPRPLPRRHGGSGRAPHAEDRQIETWLGELRGAAVKPGERAVPTATTSFARPTDAQLQPSNEPTAAIPTARISPDRSARLSADAETAAFATSSRADSGPTEKIDAHEVKRRRRGGNLSAQDVLRREARNPTTDDGPPA